MDPVLIFTKPDCPHCAGAKEALRDAGVPFEEADVTASARSAHAAVYASGAVAVPQLFAGAHYVGDAATVGALAKAGRLRSALSGKAPPLALDAVPDDRLAEGAEDLALGDAIPEIDPISTDDPEQRAILRHFRETFGFLPNSAYTQIRWPEAYKLYSYSHYFDAEARGAEVLGMAPMLAVSWATSDAHGCNYCRVHTTNMGGDEGGIARAVRDAREGRFDEDGPIGPFEFALADLVAAAIVNAVTDEHLARVRETHAEARATEHGVRENVEAVAMVAAAFGFLNVFNDAVNVPVEREWAANSEENAGIGTGRHGTSADRASDNLDGAPPEGGPSFEDMKAKYERMVTRAGGVEAYCGRELGLLPSWIAAWPEDRRDRHAVFYAEIMGESAHSVLPSELKHLMARVAAIARGHDALAAAEGMMAVRAAPAGVDAVERVARCWEGATARLGGRTAPHGPFDDRERAALAFARLSALMPLATPRHHVEPLMRTRTPRELVEMSFVVALASMVGRFSAIARPELEPATRAFLAEHGLPLHSLAIRVPEPAHAAIPSRVA